MKRKTKNIVMGLLLVFLIALNYITVVSMKRTEMYSENFYDSKKMEFHNDGQRQEPPIMGEEKRPEMPNMVPSDWKKEASGTLALHDYILLFIENFLIMILVLYLLISKGNQKSGKEVFKTSQQFFVFALLTILLSGILTKIDIFF